MTISHSVIALGSLRGGIVMAMMIVANLVTVQHMGEISAVYAVVAAGAQIFGYALSNLALHASKDADASPEMDSQIALACFSFWLCSALLIFGVGVFMETAVRVALFNKAVSPFSFQVGVLWLCGMTLEIMAVGIAMGRQKMTNMARFGVLQALLYLFVTPIAIIFFGYEGFIVLALLSYVSGLLIIFSMKPFKYGFYLYQISNKFINNLSSIIGPSILVAISAVSLNLYIVNQITLFENSLYNLAVFAICMQIFSIFSFIPQIIYTSFTSILYNNFAASKNVYRHLLTGSFISLLSCGLAAAVMYATKNNITLLFGQSYREAGPTLVVVSLLLVVQGPLQILTQTYVLHDRQWYLTFISFLSSAAGMAYFASQDAKTSVTMAASLLVAALCRIALVLGDMAIVFYDDNSCRNYKK